MQYVAVGIIGGAYSLGVLSDVAIGEIYLQANTEAYVEGEQIVNLLRREVINIIRYGLEKHLSLEQIISLEKLANESIDINKAYKQGKQIYEFINTLKKIVK